MDSLTTALDDPGRSSASGAPLPFASPNSPTNFRYCWRTSGGICSMPSYSRPLTTIFASLFIALRTFSRFRIAIESGTVAGFRQLRIAPGTAESDRPDGLHAVKSNARVTVWLPGIKADRHGYGINLPKQVVHSNGG